MAERNELSEPDNSDAPKKHRWNSHLDFSDYLRQADAIDWWQERRWVAHVFCQRSSAELRDLAQARVDALPTQELMREVSTRRKALEFELLQRIQQAEACLAMELEYVLPATLCDADDLTKYAGWSMSDLGKLALGGSGTAAAATVAARASPGLLGMIGLGAAAAVVTPVAITVGTAVFAWSAATAVGEKRKAYLTLVQDAVTRLVFATDSVEGSVLSRHLRRLDEVYNQNIENAS